LQRAVAARLREQADELGHALVTGLAGDVRGVHRARVASRRLAEAVPVAAAILGDDLDAVRRQLRRLRRALGAIREIDVIRATLAQQALDRRWPTPLVDRVDAHAVTMRDTARERMRRRVARDAAAALPKHIKALATEVEQSRSTARGDSLLASRLSTRAKGLARALAATGVLYAPEALHALRIAVKKLRYTLELAREVARLPVSAPLRELKAAQESLGGLRDVQQLQHQVNAAAAESGIAGTMRVYEAWAAQLDTECRERHAAFVQTMSELERLVGPLAVEMPLRLVRARPGRAKAVAVRRQTRSRRVAGER
jgi:CHAD domain-containing protein